MSEAHLAIGRSLAQAQIVVPQEGHPLAGDHAHQPADVVARCAQHRVQAVALRSFQVTTVHAVITLKVPDDWLDRLPALDPLLLLCRERLELALVLDGHPEVVRIHVPIAQVHIRRHRLDPRVLHQDGSLLQLHPEGVSVVRVAGECARTHDQVVFERGGNAHFTPNSYGACPW